MSAIETEITSKSPHKPLVWKRFIDDIFSLWNVDKEEIYSFIELANNHHPTIKFTAEVSETETAFLDTCIYKGERFKKESILDVRTHFKPTETFQYTYFSSCHQVASSSVIVCTFSKTFCIKVACILWSVVSVE